MISAKPGKYLGNNLGQSFLASPFQATLKARALVPVFAGNCLSESSGAHRCGAQQAGLPGDGLPHLLTKPGVGVEMKQAVLIALFLSQSIAFAGTGFLIIPVAGKTSNTQKIERAPNELCELRGQSRTDSGNDQQPGIIGEKPEGYPRTFIKRLPDRPGFCIEVTEDWREYPYQGETMWLKEKTIKSLNCPEATLPGSYDR